MQYKLATETWSETEKTVAKAVIDSGYCTMGKLTKQFEEDFATKFGTKYAVFSNSGSSANLLAVSALLYTKTNFLKPGDEVIVPAVSWSTTYYPVHQCGFKLVFVDVNHEDFNISVEEIEKAITPKTKAIFAVNLLGMPCDFDKIKELCEKHKLRLLIDNCESMGSTYNGKESGTLGDIGTYSLFFSHHINSIEGGVCVTNDEELYQIMVCLRAHGWLRNLPNENHIFNKSGDMFEDSFKFVLPGYNLRPNEVNAAIGIEQLKKLDDFVSFRQKNLNYIDDCLTLQEMHDELHIQTSTSVNKRSSSFGFGFILNDKYNRKEVTQHLMNNGIECRPIVAGNFAKNPVIKYMDHRVVGDLPNSQLIDTRGFFIGNNGEYITDQIDYFIQKFSELI